MPAAKHRRCMICERLVDPTTRQCPTPEACDAFRRPWKRQQKAEAVVAARIRQAEVEHRRIGVRRKDVRVPAAANQERRRSTKDASRAFNNYGCTNKQQG